MNKEAKKMFKKLEEIKMFDIRLLDENEEQAEVIELIDEIKECVNVANWVLEGEDLTTFLAYAKEVNDILYRKLVDLEQDE